MSRQAAKTKSLANQFAGKLTEPNFTPLNSDKMELVKGLNFYAANSSPENQKEWAIEYCRTHYPQGLENVKGASKGIIGTYGSLARLHSRGYILKPDTLARMHAFFDSLAPDSLSDHYDADGAPIIEEPKPKSKVVRSINPAMRNLDDNMDLVLEGKPYKIQVLEGELGEVVSYCEHELSVIEEEPEAYLPAHRRDLKRLFNDTLEACKAAKLTAKQERIRKVTKRAVPPAKQVAKVKFMREDTDTGLKSLNPQAVLGRTKMYVFDTARRRFMCFVGTSAGFAFKGTTVCNVDLAKSSFKRVRKPAQFFKSLGGTNVSALNKGFAAINGKESPLVTTRLNQNCIIVEVTNY